MSAIGALGAGLMRYGELKDDRRKEVLLERLEKEREQRADDRDVAREDRATKREKAKVASQAVTKGVDGNYMKVYKNSDGEELRREPATPEDVDTYNYQQQERKNTLEDAIVNQGYKKALTHQAEAAAEDAPLDRQLKRENLESMIQARHDNTEDRRQAMEDRRNGAYGNNNSLGAAMNGDDSAGAEVLRKWADDRGKQMVKDGVMSQYEYDKWLQGVIQTARKLGVDPRQVYEDQAKILTGD